jgi:hypothetical protein
MVYTRHIDELTGQLQIDISPEAEEDITYGNSGNAAEATSFQAPLYPPGFFGSL